ncbi:MAG: hypothetical protein K2Z81_19020 [Cyanobacteria bacterium]|nr:hypothetical protein [Cyanobacteriota bacterium]
MDGSSSSGLLLTDTMSMEARSAANNKPCAIGTEHKSESVEDSSLVDSQESEDPDAPRMWWLLL